MAMRSPARGGTPAYEDDDEEDELLQQALAEQAAREVKHAPPSRSPMRSPMRSPLRTKTPPPPPSKPAPQPTKPPPPVTSASAGPPRRIPPPTPPKRAPPQPPPIEDDDSDVEMLSISSEDEGVGTSSHRAATRHQVKPAAHARGVAPAAADDEALEWDEEDEEEPVSWNHVDQPELVRRVREIRETRGASAVTHLQRARTVVDPVLSRSEDLIDPLGLGIIDVRTLTLVPKSKSGENSPSISATSSSERGSGKRGFLRSRKSMKAPVVQALSKEDEESSPSLTELPVIRDQATREKVLYLSEKFDPKFYLSHVHQNTSAVELEGAEDALKQDLKLRNDELKKLVKENFDCFISCKNTIDDIHAKLQHIESSTDGGGTTHLSNSIKQVDVVANRAFAPLLERQAQVERIRSVQGMLQRFRTLFNLPSIIRGHISKGEYDQAIREYKKAKSLELYSHVGILKRVLEEVDKIVQEFKETLYKSMEDPCVSVSQLESTIRLLLELEPDSDPVWYYLTVQDRKIRGLLEGCSLEHEAHMEAFTGRVRDRVLSDARWKQLQLESNKASDVDYSLLLGDNEKDGKQSSLSDSTSNESDALLGRLIRRLTIVIVHHVPIFWRLALSIFSGKFGTGSNAIGRSLSRGSAGSGRNPYEVSDKATGTSHSLEEVEMMVHCIISLYESKVQAAFLSLAEANVLRPYMRDAVAEISKACVALQGNDASPSSAVQMLLALRTEVTRVFVLRICTIMHSATAELVNDEDWEPVPAVERMSSAYAISSLPLRFQELMTSAINHLTEMLERLKKDAPQLHEDMLGQLHQMQDTVRDTFFECFITLAENLEKLANELAVEAAADGDKEGEEEEDADGDYDKFVGLIAGVEVINTHQRLLMVLSNAGYCHSVILPEQSQIFEFVWNYEGSEGTNKGTVPGGNMATYEDVTTALTKLEEKVLTHYNTSKAREIYKVTGAYLDDGTQWPAAPPVKGLRYSMMELMHPLVTMHAEVFAGAKPFLEKAISSLVEALMNELVNIFTETSTTVFHRLDLNGYCQLMLEAEYLQHVLESYLTPQAHEQAENYRVMLFEKVMDTVGDGADHHRPGRGGSQDGTEHRGMAPEDVQGLAQDHIQSFLPLELQRTRLNVLCFTDALPEHNSGVLARRGSQSQLRHRNTIAYGSNASGRKSAASSISDSESGKMATGGLPPISSQDRYSRVRNHAGRASLRTHTPTYVDNDDIR